MRILLIILFLIHSAWLLSAQTLAEQLGYSANDKLLIVTFDNGGMFNANNEATFDLMQIHKKSNASLMIPCPWIYQIAQFSKRNPQYSYGIQFTLLSEWKNIYQWSPIANVDSVKSLVANNGVFESDLNILLEQNANIEDVRTELEAQISKARMLEIPISFFDSQYSILSYKQEFWNIYADLAYKYNLPMRFINKPNFHGNDVEARKKILDSLGIIYPDYVLIDEIALLHSKKNFELGMDTLLANINVGVTELVLHPAKNSAEIKPFPYKTWVDEYNWLKSSALEDLIKKYNIKLISYKDLQNLQIKKIKSKQVN